MRKKTASGVLVAFRLSTYRKGTPRVFTDCALLDGHFAHPAGHVDARRHAVLSASYGAINEIFRNLRRV